MSPAPADPGSLPLVKPALAFYTQRVDDHPWVNCMMYSLCMVLRWGGYDVPRDFGMALRKASGVPIYSSGGVAQGTGSYDSKVALDVLLPGAPVEFRVITDAELLDLGSRYRRRRVFRVMVRMEKLSRHLRRWCGYTWAGYHAIALGKTRVGADGEWEVYWLDPMGQPSKGYAGEWVKWSAVKSAIYRAPDGRIRATWMQRGAAYGG